MSWLEIIKHNFWQTILWFDQGFGILFSTLVKQKGYADITLSARAYLWEQESKFKWLRKVIDIIFFWQKEHCKDAWETEKKLGHFPPEMR